MVLAGLMSACLQTLQVFIILLVFVCMQLRAHTRLVTSFLFSPKCTLTVCHLRAQHRNVSELYFDQWVFQMPLPILRSKADVSLALKLQSHSWQRHNSRRPELLSGGGMTPGRAICFSIIETEICGQTISLTFTLKTHHAHHADLQSAQCPRWLFCQLVNLTVKHQTLCFALVKTLLSS